MKMTSDMANKTLKNIQAEISALIEAESRDKTYSYGISETPTIPDYSFEKTQEQLAELRDKAAKIKHAINKFNITTKVKGFDLTVDEALGRMSLLHAEKSRLFGLLQIPEKRRERTFGSKEPDYICRNFNIDAVQKEYDSVCDELMRIQQAINIANLTKEFEIPIEEI